MKTAVPLQAVESSQIAAIGHDAATNTLAIQFWGKAGAGSLYHYSNFNAEDFAAFSGSESVGKHFYAHIKPFPEKYPYSKVETPPATPTPAPADAEAAPRHHANRDDLAGLLNGREYRKEISAAEENAAKNAGLLVIFGASDDLIEFRGVENNEIEAYLGGSVFIDGHGVLPDRESIEDDDKLKAFFERQPGAKLVEGLWCAEDGYSWTFKTDVPHATFEIVEGDEKYCRGIVIDLADLVPVVS